MGKPATAFQKTVDVEEALFLSHSLNVKEAELRNNPLI